LKGDIKGDADHAQDFLQERRADWLGAQQAGLGQLAANATTTINVQSCAAATSQLTIGRRLIEAKDAIDRRLQSHDLIIDDTAVSARSATPCSITSGRPPGTCAERWPCSKPPSHLRGGHARTGTEIRKNARRVPVR